MNYELIGKLVILCIYILWCFHYMYLIIIVPFLDKKVKELCNKVKINYYSQDNYLKEGGKK